MLFGVVTWNWSTRLVTPPNSACPQSPASVPERLPLYFKPRACHNGSWLLDVFGSVRGGVGHATRWAGVHELREPAS